MTTNRITAGEAIEASVTAYLAGAATPRQAELVEAVTKAATQLIGPLVEVMDLPWEELNELQRWVRQQSAAADAARQSPPLADMQSVFDLLVATSNHSGPSLRLAPGANVLALDANQRRYLIPAVTHETLVAIRKAPSMAEAKKASRLSGGVRFHWSVERAGLIPDEATLTERLPLPDGGCYLVLYQASLDVATKPGFLKAATALVSTQPVGDVLFWDTHGDTPALWSLRGEFGHAGGADLDLPEHIASATVALRTALTRSLAASAA